MTDLFFNIFRLSFRNIICFLSQFLLIFLTFKACHNELPVDLPNHFRKHLSSCLLIQRSEKNRNISDVVLENSRTLRIVTVAFNGNEPNESVCHKPSCCIIILNYYYRVSNNVLEQLCYFYGNKFSEVFHYAFGEDSSGTTHVCEQHVRFKADLTLIQDIKHSFSTNPKIITWETQKIFKKLIQKIFPTNPSSVKIERHYGLQ